MWQDAKKKKDDEISKAFIKKNPARHRDSLTSSADASTSSRYKDNAKYMKAADDYMRRKDQELLNHLVVSTVDHECCDVTCHVCMNVCQFVEVTCI